MSIKNQYGVTDWEKQIVTYKKFPEYVQVYDGTDLMNAVKEDFRLDQKNFYTSPFKYIKCANGKSLEETHLEFVQDADLLKKHTSGLINLYKTGTYQQTALHLFNHFQVTWVPEPITVDEGKWIENSSIGAIIFAKPYTGKLFKYDICSMYPSLLQNNNILYPIKPGQFKTLSKFDIDHHTAIYRCRITGPDKRLFRENKLNYYTSHDVRRAGELSYNIQLIKDGKPNVLVYERKDCKTGAQLFGEFVKYLFNLKEEHKIKSAKRIMNCLWGALCRKTIKQLIVTDDQTEILEIYDNYEIIEFVSTGNGDKTLIKLGRTDKSNFAHDWARIMPFLLSKGRSMLSKLIEPVLTEVVRCHTDSAFCTSPCLPMETTVKIGQLRYEGFCENATINNGVHYEGEFKF